MIMYDTYIKQRLDGIIIVFSYVGPQNMMDGVFISIESIYLV